MKQLLFIVALTLTALVLPAQVFAQATPSNNRGYNVDWQRGKYLKGIDTVIESDNLALDADEILGIDHGQTRPWVINTLKEVFSSQPWISIQHHLDVPPSDLAKPNMIVLEVLVSARNEIINHKLVTTAALSVQIRQPYHYTPNLTPSIIFSPNPVTYPFLVSDSKEELEKQFTDGVRYLTSYLPTAIYCDNKAKPGERVCDSLIGYVEKDLAPRIYRANVLREQAEKGDLHAQFKTCINYALGDGVEKDIAAAARWHFKLRAQGDPGCGDALPNNALNELMDYVEAHPEVRK